ncbi:hypothetical protein TWF694_005477 [Orbilia ellipsospora]|uniref:Uncharacterized protein n=1 Tax=Orbilia ellipsospora TaxID=2528407 RepID=A0AAV9WVC3_9PEZI
MVTQQVPGGGFTKDIYQDSNELERTHKSLYQDECNTKGDSKLPSTVFSRKENGERVPKSEPLDGIESKIKQQNLALEKDIKDWFSWSYLPASSLEADLVMEAIRRRNHEESISRLFIANKRAEIDMLRMHEQERRLYWETNMKILYPNIWDV